MKIDLLEVRLTYLLLRQGRAAVHMMLVAIEGVGELLLSLGACHGYLLGSSHLSKKQQRMGKALEA